MPTLNTAHRSSHPARSTRLLAAAVWATAGIPASMNAQPKYTIAYSGFAPLNTEIFIADTDGRNSRPFLANSAQDFNASFSRDGNRIVFTSDRRGSADIYRAHPDGTGLEQLTDDPSFDDQAALSPDGRTLAFISSRSGHGNSGRWISQPKSFITSPTTQEVIFGLHGRRMANGSPSPPTVIRRIRGVMMASS